MRRLCRLLTMCLAFSALLCCCSPGGTAPSLTSSDTEAVTEAWEDAGVLGSDGSCEFTIVRPENASPEVLSAASYVYKVLRAYFPGISITDDWSKTPLSDDELAGRYEILIGNTNRPASAAAAEGLNARQYRILRQGRKLIIVGGSDRALTAACSAFNDNITADEGRVLFLPPELTGETGASWLIAVTDQKNSKVEVFDLADEDLASGRALWSHVYYEYNIADTRLRSYNGADVVLAAFGGSSASMVDYNTGKNLWSTTGTANNPHAAELIPFSDGSYVIAVAASTGGEIRFFILPSASAAVTVKLEDAHGVLWDPERQVLWAQGTNILTAYELALSGGKLTVNERTDLRDTIPTTNAHDLQPDYDDKDKLLVTTSSAVYLYSKSQKKFYTEYEGSDIVNRKDVKGIGRFPDGSLVYIVPDGDFRTWTGATVYWAEYVGGKLTKKSLKSPDGGYYKVRVWNSNYQ